MIQKKYELINNLRNMMVQPYVSEMQSIQSRKDRAIEITNALIQSVKVLRNQQPINAKTSPTGVVKLFLSFSIDDIELASCYYPTLELFLNTIGIYTKEFKLSYNKCTTEQKAAYKKFTSLIDALVHIRVQLYAKHFLPDLFLSKTSIQEFFKNNLKEIAIWSNSDLTYAAAYITNLPECYFQMLVEESIVTGESFVETYNLSIGYVESIIQTCGSQNLNAYYQMKEELKNRQIKASPNKKTILENTPLKRSSTSFFSDTPESYSQLIQSTSLVFQSLSLYQDDRLTVDLKIEEKKIILTDYANDKIDSRSSLKALFRLMNLPHPRLDVEVDADLLATAIKDRIRDKGIESSIPALLEYEFKDDVLNKTQKKGKAKLERHFYRLLSKCSNEKKEGLIKVKKRPLDTLNKILGLMGLPSLEETYSRKDRNTILTEVAIDILNYIADQQRPQIRSFDSFITDLYRLEAEKYSPLIYRTSQEKTTIRYEAELSRKQLKKFFAGTLGHELLYETFTQSLAELFTHSGNNLSDHISSPLEDNPSLEISTKKLKTLMGAHIVDPVSDMTASYENLFYQLNTTLKYNHSFEHMPFSADTNQSTINPLSQKPISLGSIPFFTEDLSDSRDTLNDDLQGDSQSLRNILKK